VAMIILVLGFTQNDGLMYSLLLYQHWSSSTNHSLLWLHVIAMICRNTYGCLQMLIAMLMTFFLSLALCSK